LLPTVPLEHNLEEFELPKAALRKPQISKQSCVSAIKKPFYIVMRPERQSNA
jgi:hypothetical protein